MIAFKAQLLDLLMITADIVIYLIGHLTLNKLFRSTTSSGHYIAYCTCQFLPGFLSAGSTSYVPELVGRDWLL